MTPWQNKQQWGCITRIITDYTNDCMAAFTLRIKVIFSSFLWYSRQLCIMGEFSGWSSYYSVNQPCSLNRSQSYPKIMMKPWLSSSLQRNTKEPDVVIEVLLQHQWPHLHAILLQAANFSTFKTLLRLMNPSKHWVSEWFAGHSNIVSRIVYVKLNRCL